MHTRKRCKAILGLLAAAFLVMSDGYAAGPGGRINPHRPNPPGPNNPIGPNNPAVSNPLSPLNPSTPFSNNQIMLRQLLQTKPQASLPSAASLSSMSVLYGNTSVRAAPAYTPKIPPNYQLLLNNRTVFSTSHPLVFQHPDPMTPLTNNYAVIHGRYYAISHDPANDASVYSSSGIAFAIAPP